MLDQNFARPSLLARLFLLVALALLPACSILRPLATPTPLPGTHAPSALPEASPEPPTATSRSSETPTSAPETPPTAPALAGLYLPAPGWPLIAPIGPYTPLPSDEPFAAQMQSSGYTLFQAGALTAPDGIVYAAYVFTRLEAGAPVGGDTFRLAFYRWNGSAAARLGDLSPAIYTRRLPVYPSYYRLVNWDDPAASQMGLVRIADPDAGVRSALHLAGQAADINSNGLPEFIFAAEYCPATCSTPLSGFDFFEIGPQGVTDLNAGLPGRLGLHPISLDPLVFETVDWLPFGQTAAIGAPSLVAWDGRRFADVTAQQAGLLEGRIDALRKQLEAGYGSRLEQETLQADAYNLLLLYARLDRAQEGLQVFLEVTDPRHWKGGSERTLCWLQLARARAQDEYTRRAEFTVLPAIVDFDPKADAPGLSAGLDAASHDLSACRRWIP